jgi:hypothetical protein
VNDRRTCPECNGCRKVEYESNEHVLTPYGDWVRSWIATCPLCGGDGEIEVEPVTLDDLRW